MNYSYVKPIGTTYEFLSDNGHEYNDVVYGNQYLASCTDEFLVSIGVYKTVLLPVPENAKTADGTMHFNKVGNKVEYRPNYILYTAEEQIEQMVQKFTNITTNYIEGKVSDYNTTNGLAFKDIDAFTKYAVTPTSTHNAIAIKFITYADNIWKAVRTYQSTATAIPTDLEFKALLDSVVF